MKLDYDQEFHLDLQPTKRKGIRFRKQYVVWFATFFCSKPATFFYRAQYAILGSAWKWRLCCEDIQVMGIRIFFRLMSSFPFFSLSSKCLASIMRFSAASFIWLPFSVFFCLILEINSEKMRDTFFHCLPFSHIPLAPYSCLSHVLFVGVDVETYKAPPEPMKNPCVFSRLEIDLMQLFYFNIWASSLAC